VRIEKEKSMIREKQKIIVERTVCTCDRCGREITREDHPDEWAERFLIRFRGGYGSQFGDGSVVEGEFCQHCIYQLLGAYCRITTDDPFQRAHSVSGEPAKIFQPYQFAEVDEVKTANVMFRFAKKTTSE
jgi:hypothetical protein